jgi:hypothetical protein
VKYEVSIPNEGLMPLLGCITRNQKYLKQILNNQKELKELIMGMKEDFATFVTDVNARTNEIGAALTDIQADIERLLAASTATPPEVLAGMEDIKTKLAALAATSTAIAALDNPVVPPPVEPL